MPAAASDNGPAWPVPPASPAQPPLTSPPLSAPPASTTALPAQPATPFAQELSGAPLEPTIPEPSAPGADPAPTELLGLGDEGGSALDDLFGEAKFRDYDAEPGPSQNPFAARSADPAPFAGDGATTVLPAGAAAPGASALGAAGLSATTPGLPADASADGSGNGTGGRPPRDRSAGVPRSQKILLWVAGSLVAVLALVALFLFGTKLPSLLGPGPAPLPTMTATPTPTPTALPLGPVKPGVYAWNELLGTECLDPFPGPWEKEYTVVDCADAHPAQLATRGTFGPDDGRTTPYPGIEALQSQVNLLCTAPTVIDYAVANAYTDIQLQAAYPVTEQDWIDGDRDYYCFLSRTSGGPITGSLAVAPVAPAPPTP